MKQGRAMRIFVLAKKLYKKGIPFLPGFLTILNRTVFSVDIPYDAKVDDSVFLGHNGLGTVIHQHSTIGKGTYVMQNVVIGGNFGKQRQEGSEVIVAPVIGENVFIAPGSHIVGPVVIEDYAVIGTGAVVIKDVKFGEVIVGNPGRVLRTMSREEAIENYKKI